MGWAADFASRLEARDLSIGVVGLGYVGLPTALGFFAAGFRVRGIDVNETLVETLIAGENPGDDPQHDGLIPVQNERWQISTDTALLADCDVILVTVPTPVTVERTPDLTYVKAAGAAVFDAIPREGRTIVVLESTVYPGVTREVWGPLLAARELIEGVDVELAYCPERFVPGDPNHGVRQVPRVVGASDAAVGEDLRQLYETLTSGGVSFVGAIEVAEAAKVVENVQRDLNIALVNELARILPEMGIDVEDVLDAAATKWNFHRYNPGIGVGGHCIPVDPYYLIKRAAASGAPAELITAARAVNHAMPTNVANDLIALLAKHEVLPNQARALLLGWSYKPGIGDARETPAEPLAKALRMAGVEVSVWDPHVDASELPDTVSGHVDDLASAGGYDLVIVVTAHVQMFETDWSALASRMQTPLFYDGRRVLSEREMVAAGWRFYALGAPL